MKFQPLGERVLVQRVEEENKTASGIIIPDSAKEKPLSGIVKAVSKDIKADLKVKDTVVFGKYAGSEVTLEGVEYLVLELKDILGAVK